MTSICAPTADSTPDEPSRRKRLARAGPDVPEAACRERERAALIASCGPAPRRAVELGAVVKHESPAVSPPLEAGALGPAHAGKPVQPHGAVAAAGAVTLSESVAGLFSLASGVTENRYL